MKSKFTLLALAAIVSIATAQAVHAEDGVAGVRTHTDVEMKAQTNVNRAYFNEHTSASETEKEDATSSRVGSKDESDMNKSESSSTDDNGKFSSESHRSMVAAFVHSLLGVADREGGIGAQVRAVAQSQNDSASVTATAFEKVEGRGSFHTFLTGSDYKNLGVLRSQIASTSANIMKIKAVLPQVTNKVDRTELNAQIKVLEDEQVKTDAYINAKENAFSLFGWLNRMFSN